MSKLIENLKKFLSKKTVLFILLIIVIYIFYNYSSLKYMFKDPMEIQTKSELTKNDNEIANVAQTELKNENGSYTNVSTNNPSDLLPIESENSWSHLNPEFNKNAIKMPDLMDPTFFAGVQSISSGKRNKNLDLRSQPLIPKMDTGPWNQTTEDYDRLRKPLEIGN